MKAIEQYFHVVLFITLYKVVLTFKSVDETLVCDHSNESYWKEILHGPLICKIMFHLQPTLEGSSNLNFRGDLLRVNLQPL